MNLRVITLLAGPPFSFAPFYYPFPSLTLPLTFDHPFLIQRLYRTMQIPVALIFALLFSIPSFAAPVPNTHSPDASVQALNVRKTTKAAPKKAAPVKAKPPAKPVAKAPVAKAKPVPKKAPVPKAPVKAVPKPAAKPAAKPVPKKKLPAPVKKPAAKAPVTKPVAKNPVAAPAKKPVSKTPTKAPVAPKAPANTPTKAKAPTPPTKAKVPAKSSTQAKAPTPAKAPVKVSAKPQASALACPVKPKAKTAVKSTKAKRIMAQLNLFARKIVIARRTFFGLIQPRLTQGNEFIGWHGTNAQTAALWESHGEIVKPVNEKGETAGTGGLDAELGVGLYLADTIETAEAAAGGNEANTKIPAKVCAIFAKSSVNWREGKDKVSVPESIRGNTAIRGQERQSYIASLPNRSPSTGKGPSILFGPLFGTRANPVQNQMMIVESLNPNFEAQCFDLEEGGESAGGRAFQQQPGNQVHSMNCRIFRQY
ncbi:hypothetical protein C8F01DRAFT_1171255 [Mycena amicta]|nr:hypothetical protein C8F01DRAFT_1171255 [Mycena amicta]